MIYLSNSFSLSMLQGITPCSIKVAEVTAQSVRQLLLKQNFTSAVGHASTAVVMSELLGLPIQANRQAISLSRGDCLIIFQLLVRLEEGKVLTREEILSLPYKLYLVQVQ